MKLQLLVIFAKTSLLRLNLDTIAASMMKLFFAGILSSNFVITGSRFRNFGDLVQARSLRRLLNQRISTTLFHTISLPG